MNLQPTVPDTGNLVSCAIEDYVNQVTLQHFSKQITYFVDAVSLSHRSNIKPGNIEHVKNARQYLTETFRGYTEVSAKKNSKYYLSLRNLKNADERVAKPCLITFLDNVSKDEAQKKLMEMIGQGEIRYIADGSLTACFVRAKLFETGKMIQDKIVIPRTFQKKVSPSKKHFFGVELLRSVDGTKGEWKLFPEEIQRGMSILAFK